MVRKIARVFELLSFVISSHAISAQITVGEGTIFFHHGCGCVVHESAVIGCGCKVFQNVTIGQKHGTSIDGVPKIGNNVMIGAGAVILGNISIGDNVIVGANAVVTTDVPENRTVVGIPGKILY